MSCSTTPILVSGLANVRAISGSCSLLSNGTVKCWGDNVNGAIGNGTTEYSFVPVSVSDLTDVTAISGTCALLSSGTVKCWGSDNYGELGNGTVTPQSPATVRGPASGDRRNKCGTIRRVAAALRSASHEERGAS
jgi:alpha-tubulin suppressor-like RCC1 family protein